jgi:hypothetical protein
MSGAEECITFRLGPLVVRVEGAHPAARWSARAFDLLRLDGPADPDVRFAFTTDPVMFDGPDALGDDAIRLAAAGVSFKSRYFETRITREAGCLTMNLRQRDRRPLWRRTASDPEKAWKKWVTQASSVDISLLKEFVYRLAPLVLQVALLERGAALIHSSSFSIEGRGILLPAWGGVGKSTLASRAVLHGKARFLADDHAVVDSHGRIHLHLLPAHLYAYHAESDALLRQRMLAADSSGAWLWKLGTELDRKHAVRWVSPVDLYGVDKIERAPVPIEQVVVMFRGNQEKFRYEEVSPERAALPCASVILTELYGFSERLAAAGAGWHPSILPDPAEAYTRIRQVYERGFSAAHCARLLIPRSATPDELIQFLVARVPLLGAAIG